MTHFEYLTVAPTLILSFSLARALSNLGPIFTSERRYWIHSAWVAVLLLNHLTVFWGFWIFHANEVWTLLEFILYVFPSIGLLVATSLLVPSSDVAEYRLHFESIRTPLYAVWIALGLVDPMLAIAMDDYTISLLVLVNVGFVLAFATGILAKRFVVDAALVVFNAAIAIGVIGAVSLWFPV